MEPFSMEVRGVRGLYALGPLRGDNFARFAIHDGHGVAEAIRARREAGGPPGGAVRSDWDGRQRSQQAVEACEAEQGVQGKEEELRESAGA